MLWFLRLFRQFRELESLAVMQSESAEECARNQADIESLREANQQLSTEKLLLEDRLESAIADKDRLWETMQESLRGERYAYQTMVNHATQKTGAGTPYPDAHSLPASEIRKPQAPGPIGRSARVLPSEMAQRQKREFVRNYVDAVGPVEAVG